MINNQQQQNDTGKNIPGQEEYKQATAYIDRGEWAQAAVALHNALVEFEESGNENGIANASDKLGDVCMAKEDFATALKHFERAYAICETADDDMSKMTLTGKIAEAQCGLKQYDEAITTYLGLIDTYYWFNSPGGAVHILEKLAQVYLLKGEREKAADAVRTAASIHANFKHERQAQKLQEKAQRIEQGAD